MEKLFNVMLSDFTEKDWQDVKDDIKEFIVEEFKNMWQEQFLIDVELVENRINDNLDDFISEQFKEMFNSVDMKEIFMKEMNKKMESILK
ncbi:hypothetical protein KQI68_07055 [Peptoniphilus sp. MSJ-1]|uniref:Uncharacterized protein n=1 Tax=Peptoniphilus ovalis TaxID=2841503 RepID=A0ABS6FI04_9FIRM|nr:hypothetical protein [Peptoniphilus ovalis]MBU5669596.1 hypothetical protein [Peptoniphilus ovalis]